MLDPLRRLIDSVPRATLAEIIHEMLAAEPAKRRPGRPRKPSRPRGRPGKPPAGNGADPGETPATPRPPARAERRAKAARLKSAGHAPVVTPGAVVKCFLPSH